MLNVKNWRADLVGGIKGFAQPKMCLFPATFLLAHLAGRWGEVVGELSCDQNF
jgi:hypothetical protein